VKKLANSQLHKNKSNRVFKNRFDLFSFSPFLSSQKGVDLKHFAPDFEKF